MLRHITAYTATAVLLTHCISAMAQNSSPATQPMGESIYLADVRFALDELPRQCGRFFELKKIDWPAVSIQFIDEAKRVKTEQEHLVLLTRLVARLKDGHASVQPLEKGKAVKWPDAPKGPLTGPGMFWCLIDGRVYVKNSFATAQAAGVRPGMEVVRVDGKPTLEWVQTRAREREDLMGFSTPNASMFTALHWGLAAPVGKELKLELKDLQGRERGVAVECRRANYVPWGPAFYPAGCKGDNNIQYAKLPSGYGYIHLRRCPTNLPTLIDGALAAIGNVPGLILDFRANGGGGFDHDALMGRFIPAGKSIRFNKAYASAGPNPYGGPIVVIIDGNTRSAGETGCCIFKEDGRAYLIGESATAGMSSSKRTIELPSKLFALYVSVSSNMGRANGGRGIEGIGIPPHEIVQYDPKDLAGGVDTLIRRAEAILKDHPQEKVPYRPSDFGWTP